MEYSNDLVRNLLSDNGICVSTNTACCSSNNESVILKELTNDKKIYETSIRISLSYLTSKDDVYEFLRVFDLIWNKLKNEM